MTEINYTSLTREEAFNILGNDPNNFKFLSAEFRNDKDIVKKALIDTAKKNEAFITDFSFKNGKLFVIAGKSNVGLLEFASNEIKDDKEFMLELISSGKPGLLPYISERLRDDKEVILEACQKYPSYIIYASKRIQELLENEENKIKALETIVQKEQLESNLPNKINKKPFKM